MADFSYTIVPFKSHGFFWVTFTGEISINRLAHTHEAFTSSEDYVSGSDELLDFSSSSVGAMTGVDIERIRQFMRERTDRHHSKSVMVVNTALEYGLGRMMGGQLSHDAPVDRNLFYSLNEALEWLRPGQAEELLTAHEAALRDPDAPGVVRGDLRARRSTT